MSEPAKNTAYDDVMRSTGALGRIKADIIKANQAALKFQQRGETDKAWRALGISEGLQAAAAYIQAERA